MRAASYKYMPKIYSFILFIFFLFNLFSCATYISRNFCVGIAMMDGIGEKMSNANREINPNWWSRKALLPILPPAGLHAYKQVKLWGVFTLIKMFI